MELAHLSEGIENETVALFPHEPAIVLHCMMSETRPQTTTCLISRQTGSRRDKDSRSAQCSVSSHSPMHAGFHIPLSYLCDDRLHSKPHLLCPLHHLKGSYCMAFTIVFAVVPEWHILSTMSRPS